MLSISEEDSGARLLKSKSLRDDPISTKLQSPPFCKNSACYYIVGSPGSGKTFLVESLFRKTFKKMFDGVFLIAPTSSRSSYADSYCKSMNPLRIYDTLTVDTLKDVLNEVDDINDMGKGEPRFSALIIDDCASDLRNKATQRLLLKSIQNHRHNRLSIFIVSQTLQSLHLSIRSCMTVLIQFKTGSIKEKKALHEEFLPDYTIKECDEILDYIFSEKYHFLLVNRRLNAICNSFNPLTIDRE